MAKRWTCFHCTETFATAEAARLHFGPDCRSSPACQIKASEGGLVAEIRRLEAKLARYQVEDSDTDRAMYAMQARHAVELREAEDKGFARGVADMRKHGWRLNEERERPDLYPALVQ
jgi:hypothetical protein